MKANQTRKRLSLSDSPSPAKFSSKNATHSDLMTALTILTSLEDWRQGKDQINRNHLSSWQPKRQKTKESLRPRIDPKSIKTQWLSLQSVQYSRAVPKIKSLRCLWSHDWMNLWSWVSALKRKLIIIRTDRNSCMSNSSHRPLKGDSVSFWMRWRTQSLNTWTLKITPSIYQFQNWQHWKDNIFHCSRSCLCNIYQAWHLMPSFCFTGRDLVVLTDWSSKFV